MLLSSNFVDGVTKGQLTRYGLLAAAKAKLVPHTDYRDAPFLWDAGDFEMDEEQLRARLSRADPVLGDVRETAAAYIKRLDHESPIGFVAFDLDFWWSTIEALPWNLRQAVPFRPAWVDQMCQFHIFDHVR
jgi:hypothetical protein